MVLNGGDNALGGPCRGTMEAMSMFWVVTGGRVFVQELYIIWSKIISENLLTNSNLRMLIVYDCFKKRIQLDDLKKRRFAAAH